MRTTNDASLRTHRGINRRHMLQVAGLDVLGLTLGNRLLTGEARAAGPPDASAIAPLNRFPRMVQHYFVDRVRRAEKACLQRQASLKTKADAEAYVRSVQERIRESFGPYPEKTPLKARITGVVERDAYRIEKVIFESRPEFLVTANLYIPKGRKFPLPGVVGTCGHSTNGKCAEAYQSFAQGLARMGYVVLIYDPIGQGERLQYPDENLKSRIGVGVREHLHAGNQQFLVGEFFGTWRAWDGMRALDYLLTRDEVDPKHVGVTGNSGGGTMTTWLCGVELRWTMAAPSCFVTTFRRNMENELPADTEQCPPRALALGLDHADFLAAQAPKPVIILAKEKDYFDVRGSEEALARLKRLYSLLGAEENIALFVGPTHHGYSQENREAMYRWFNRATGVSDAQTEPELVIEKDETLWCTPKGQVVELDSRPVFSYTKAKSEALAKKRPALAGDALVEAVRETLKLPPREGLPAYRILRAIRSRKYPKSHFVTYAVETEPGVHALVYRLLDERHYSRPPRGYDRAVLYVSHQSADAELRDEPLLGELLEKEPDSAFRSGHVPERLRERLLLRHPRPDARLPVRGPENARRPARARLAQGLRPQGGALGREGLGGDPGHVCRASVGRRGPGDAQERADFLRRRRPVGGLPLAPFHAPAGRAGAVRPARLLPCPGSEEAASDRTLGAGCRRGVALPGLSIRRL